MIKGAIRDDRSDGQMVTVRSVEGIWRRQTPGLRLAVLVAAVGAAMISLKTPPAAMLAVGIGLLVICAVAHRAERERRRLQTALQREQHERNSVDRQVAAERGELTSKLEFWATHDPVTGLANRTRLTRAIGEALSDEASFGVLIISIADFATVHSTYGSAVGDEVLHALASRLQHALRVDDMAGRLGGNDFGVLLRGVDLPDAHATSERLLGVFDHPIVVGDTSITLQAQAGLALRVSDDECDAVELLRQAEVAAVASKPSDVVRVFAPALQLAAAERNQLEADLRRSLDAGEFVCHYQPLVNSSDGRISSVEALVRWNHPTRGHVLPHDFIAAAERCGLIVPLGLEVLTQACQQLRTWQAAGRIALSVAVNMSARQLAEPGFIDSVKNIVWSAGVDPRHLIFEITESLLVEDGEAAIATLWQLRGLGLRLAVDDFGTGYSSLSRLSDLPIDEMKIDKSFTDRIHARVGDAAPIIAAAVAMGQALGLTVVAEGVETASQADFLRDIGCDLMQGYLFSRPLTADLITPMLTRVMLDPMQPTAMSAGDPGSRGSGDEHVFVPRILPSLARTAPRRRAAR